MKNKIDKVQFINELSRERLGKIPPKKVIKSKKDKYDYWDDSEENYLENYGENYWEDPTREDQDF